MPYKAGSFKKYSVKLNKKIGKRVKELRVKHNLSQEQLGFKAKIHRNYIGEMERAESLPSLVTIEKLCKALDMTFAEFFNGV